jgi:hypothetical protein
MFSATPAGRSRVIDHGASVADASTVLLASIRSTRATSSETLVGVTVIDVPCTVEPDAGEKVARGRTASRCTVVVASAVSPAASAIRIVTAIEA